MPAKLRFGLLTSAFVLIGAPTWAYSASPGVAWFLAHPGEMQMKKAWCMDHPGESVRIPECENAIAAWWQVQREAFVRRSRQ